nr:tyrosine aminotransferase-like isoform X2 [Quercus suber]
MENGTKQIWGFRGNEELKIASEITVRGFLNLLMFHVNKDDDRPTVPLGHGDPSAFPSFRTTGIAEDAIVDALRTANYNCYAPTVGVLPERRPGFPYYEARAACSRLEVRHFDLLPEKGWKVNLEAVEALADQNTVAMVIINPGNPCGNVYSHQHLEKIAETARKLGILVITDEVYNHLTYGSNPFVPMGTFGSIAPVITLGSISKRWIVPGWRCGWLVTNDPNGILRKTGIVDSIKGCLDVSSDPATFIQGAIPQILENTKEDFFSKIIYIIREAANLCYERIKEIPCITCPYKPEGSMYTMVKLNLCLLEDIGDDMEFCLKLAKEESVIVLPGMAVGMKNWLRITIAIELSTLEDGLARIKAFCQRHAKNNKI